MVALAVGGWFAVVCLALVLWGLCKQIRRDRLRYRDELSVMREDNERLTSHRKHWFEQWQSEQKKRQAAEKRWQDEQAMRHAADERLAQIHYVLHSDEPATEFYRENREAMDAEESPA